VENDARDRAIMIVQSLMSQLSPNEFIRLSRNDALVNASVASSHGYSLPQIIPSCDKMRAYGRSRWIHYSIDRVRNQGLISLRLCTVYIFSCPNLYAIPYTWIYLREMFMLPQTRNEVVFLRLRGGCFFLFILKRFPEGALLRIGYGANDVCMRKIPKVIKINFYENLCKAEACRRASDLFHFAMIYY